MLNKADLETLNQVRQIIGDKTHLHGDAIAEPMNDATDKIFDILLDMAKTTAPLPKRFRNTRPTKQPPPAQPVPVQPKPEPNPQRPAKRHHRPEPHPKIPRATTVKPAVDVDFVIQEILEKHREEIETVIAESCRRGHGKLLRSHQPVLGHKHRKPGENSATRCQPASGKFGPTSKSWPDYD